MKNYEMTCELINEVDEMMKRYMATIYPMDMLIEAEPEEIKMFQDAMKLVNKSFQLMRNQALIIDEINDKLDQLLDK